MRLLRWFRLGLVSFLAVGAAACSDQVASDVDPEPTGPQAASRVGRKHIIERAGDRLNTFRSNCMNEIDPVLSEVDPQEANPPMSHLAEYLRGSRVNHSSFIYKDFRIEPKFVGDHLRLPVTYTLDDLMKLTSKGFVGEPYGTSLMIVYSTPDFQQIGQCLGGDACKTLVQRRYICSKIKATQVVGKNPTFFGPLTTIHIRRINSIVISVKVLNHASPDQALRVMNEQLRLRVSGAAPTGL